MVESDEDFIPPGKKKPRSKKTKKIQVPRSGGKRKKDDNVLPKDFFDEDPSMEDFQEANKQRRLHYNDPQKLNFFFIDKEGKLTTLKREAHKMASEMPKVDYLLIGCDSTVLRTFFVDLMEPRNQIKCMEVFYIVKSRASLNISSMTYFKDVVWINQTFVRDIDFTLLLSLTELEHQERNELQINLSDEMNPDSLLSQPDITKPTSPTGRLNSGWTYIQASSSSTNNKDNISDSLLPQPEITKPASPKGRLNSGWTSMQTSSSSKEFSKFNLNLLNSETKSFIASNSSDNTRQSNRTITNLFNEFLKETQVEKEQQSLFTLTVEKFPEVVEKFFMCLQKEGGSKYNAGSLQVYFNSLARVLLSERNVNLKSEEFAKAKQVLKTQQRVSVAAGERPGKHSSNAIPAEVLARCWNEGAFGDSNPKALIAGLMIRVEMSFGTRPGFELATMENQDLIPGPIREDGLPSVINFSERLTKTRKGVNGQGARETIPRMFPDDSNQRFCGVRLYVEYQNRKPSDAKNPSSRFWLNFRNFHTDDWSQHPLWFSNSPMGVNTIRKAVVRQIASIGIDCDSLGITGNSVRKTNIDGCLSAGVPGHNVSLHVGHNSLASKLSYISNDVPTAKAMAKIVDSVITGSSNNGLDYQDILKQEKEQEAKRIKQLTKPNEEEDSKGRMNSSLTSTVSGGHEAAGGSRDPNVENDDNDEVKKLRKKVRKLKKRSKSKKKSSSSSSTSTTSLSSSEDEKRKYKKKIKKLKRKLKKKKKLESSSSSSDDEMEIELKKLKKKLKNKGKENLRPIFLMPNNQFMQPPNDRFYNNIGRNPQKKEPLDQILVDEID